MESHTTVIIPFDDRVIFVCLLNRAEFPSRLSEVAQTLDAVSGIQVWSFAGGSERRGFLARSESAAAPGYDGGGCGALRSLGIRFLVIWVIVHCSFQEATEQRPSLSSFSLLDQIQHSAWKRTGSAGSELHSSDYLEFG